ncbi:MAG: hypothetical protein ABJ327_17965 [Litoreibacter sp.]
MFLSMLRTIVAVSLLTLPGGAMAGVESPLLNNLTSLVGQRIKIIFENPPDNFREDLIRSDSKGIIDDIAIPGTLNEADLAIFFFSSGADFKNSRFYADLGPLADVILPGLTHAAHTVDLNVDSLNGPRHLRLFFFNELAGDEEHEEESPMCFATRIYALSMFDEVKEALQLLMPKC